MYVSSLTHTLPGLCFLPLQAEMRENYGQLAALLDATGLQGLDLIRRMEHLRPDPPIAPGTVRDLRRLHTDAARCQLIGHLPAKTHATLKAFQRALDMADKWQWVQWHWAMAPDSHLHPDNKGDMNLQAALTKTVTLKALKVNLGSWQWRPGTQEAPRWETLQRAGLWTDVYYSAMRRRLAAERTKWHCTDTPDSVLSLCPKRCDQVHVVLHHHRGLGRGFPTWAGDFGWPPMAV